VRFAPVRLGYGPHMDDVTQDKTICPHCLGTGSREGEDCITCGGTGVAPPEDEDD